MKDRILRRLNLLWLLVLPAISINLCLAQSATTPQGNSIIRGRVVFDHNDRAVRRPSLLLFQDLNHPAVKRTVGNNRGEFQFTEVAAGSYFVVANYRGVISKGSAVELSDFGFAQQEDEPLRTKVTVDGTNEQKVEVRLLPGSSISGTITYSDNEPALRMDLVLYRRHGTRTVPVFTDPVKTDDRGFYRFESLPPGEYFVGVSESMPALDPIRAIGMMPHRLMPLAFYPGVSTFKEAKAIELSKGSEAKGISFVINDGKQFEISGSVKWRSSGKPIGGTLFSLRRKDDPQLDVSIFEAIDALTPPNSDSVDNMMRNASLMIASESFKLSTGSDGEGNWKFKNVVAGTYLLSVTAQLPQEKKKKPNENENDLEGIEDWDPKGAGSIQRTLEIIVRDEDAKDIVVEMTEGSRIYGNVTLKDSTPVRARLSISRPGPTDLMGSLPHETKEDGSFVIEGVAAGEIWIDLDPGPRSHLYVSSMSLGGVDLMREPLKVVDGAEIVGLKINLGIDVANLSGRVVSSNSSSETAAVGVLVVPVDPKLWHLRSGRRFQLTKANGEFSMFCAPGDHLIFMWPANQPPAQPIEEFMRSRINSARRISVSPSEDKKIELVLSPPQK